MKSLMFLWRSVANELAAISHTSIALDYKKLESRVEHEGDEFLTITLPSIAQGLERGLERGSWDPSDCAAFRHRGGLPLFLGGFLDQVFDRSSGRILARPDVDSIFAVRQLSLMFKKISIPCSNARVEHAIDGYVGVDRELADWYYPSKETQLAFQRMANLVFGEPLLAVQVALNQGELVPKHGPGVTADRLLGNKKYLQVEWPWRLEDMFAYSEHALPNLRHFAEEEGVSFLEPEDERPVKVITVPKTLKTPRIIAIEPTCMQFMQQAISQRIVQELERPYGVIHGHDAQYLSYGFVGFSDQDPNRVMAKEGSMSGRLATLDMSEASDRVHNQHVRDLLACVPALSRAVQACRSTKADVPGYGVIPLTKFASMGSALTFPLEAMVFTTIIFLALEKQAMRQFTPQDVKSLRGKVRVYGDDIIIPIDSVVPVVTELESFGMKVNSNKSFWNGKFRESCGGDYYDGHWVTPVYVRHRLPRSREDVAEVVSLVSFRNQLYKAGLWQSVRVVDRMIEEVLPLFPTVQDTSPVLGRHSFLPYQVDRWSDSTHGPLVQGYTVRSALPDSYLDGVGALHKCLAKLQRRKASDSLSYLFPEVDDPKHLQRAGRPLDVGLTRGWRSPY